MSVHRGVVSEVGPAGVFVRVAEFGPSALPASLVGPLPSVGASVLVLDAGEQGAPDLVVVTDLALGGAVSGAVRFGPAGGSMTLSVSGAFGVIEGPINLRLRAGTTQVQVTWNGAVLLSRQTQSGDAADALVTKGYVDAVKSALAASSDFADFKARVAAL